MSAGAAGVAGAAEVELWLSLDGRTATVRAPLPQGPQPAEALLPLMRAVVDAVVDDRVARSAAAGQPVRCTKGCSACCRSQPVPITPPEARAIAALVERQSTPRRAVLRARFADRVERLRAAGLLGVFSRAEPLADAAAAAVAARAYQRLGLVCPFLDDDACSIHADRPFVCREYLVTSDPAACAEAPPRTVAVLPLPLRPAVALLQATHGGDRAQSLTVPLVLALDHVARQAAPAPRETTAVLADWLGALAPSQ